ncbi:MAG: preprotein translocase subunit SecA [Kiritimatiellia bacterium]|jgi:preprotein translocase subunit SecA|nr:preprotein translocase subunit SecA [Kiritimatiellia bacterium]MDP6811081.1 preprotein translocase subunit SecA [Kiritimatiellia bacterium]MDP7024458.1 preprotein translocase subunit SecA [Kiritimatiellia bacterium]
MLSAIQKIFGTKHQRDIKQMMPEVERINALEEEYQSLSEAEVKAKTDEFRSRLEKGETLEDIMVEAFAVVKNACRRLVGTTEMVSGHELTWDMVPFDTQLIGGIVLHGSKIAEMATGEGKTLVATMPVYLNALTGKGVHLVTVNDYLARRDSQWMGLVYEYLGLTVGCIQNQMSPDERRQEYACDITYGTNSEFGFDYLRDNGMAFDAEHQVQRGHYYAIIDEVDSILIDEARTPLIISGPAPHSSNQYFELKPRVEQLVRKQRALCNGLVTDIKKHLDAEETEAAQYLLYQVYHGMPKHKQLMHMLEDPAVRRLHEQVENMMLTDMRKEQARELREELFFTIDERGHDASLTEKGCEALNPTDPEAYVLPDLISAMSELDGKGDEVSEQEKTRQRQEIQQTYSDRGEKIHNVDQLIRAYCLYERDVGYVVQDNRVMIVDEFTGRILPGRRWSDGLHQAVEAKEGVKIERETQTLATITIQNYFRMYEKLSGMTGTAETEANEFRDIYALDVVVIPTNRPVRRVDSNDRVYKSQREKFGAVIEEIREYHDRGQPVLVGTVTVDTSEVLSRMLKRAGIVHNVLNAKNHEAEAEIVTRAGQPGAVTIATNMAGRGTDIKLGKGVVKLEREVILSQTSLEDRFEGGKTLRAALEEEPCGLHVIASERHESRRIDRQLRGRCARQGDPGSSRFYVSLEDDLMRLFGSDRIAGIMERLGLEEGQELEHKWLNRSIETAQRRVEQHNYSIRKRTLEYDDVMNRQREVIYGFRGDIVRADNIREQVYDILHDVILEQAEALPADPDEASLHDFIEWVQLTFPIAFRAGDLEGLSDPEAVAQTVFKRVERAYELKCQIEDPGAVEMMERQIVLQSVDTQWQDYLRSMDALRQGVVLRAYGQRDPLVEYKREAFEMFGQLMTSIKQDIASAVFRTTTNVESFESFISSLPQTLVHDDVSLLGAGGAAPPVGMPPPAGLPPQGAPPAGLPGGPPPGAMPGVSNTVHRDAEKVGRNDPCPCGSGKKFKKCHGA